MIVGRGTSEHLKPFLIVDVRFSFAINAHVSMVRRTMVPHIVFDHLRIFARLAGAIAPARSAW